MDRDNLIKLCKSKDEELGKCSEKIEALKTNLTVSRRKIRSSNGSIGTDDLVRRIREEKGKCLELEQRLDCQTQLKEKTEIALKTKDYLVSAKDEIITGLKIIIGNLEQQNALEKNATSKENLTSNTTMENDNNPNVNTQQREKTG